MWDSQIYNRQELSEAYFHLVNHIVPGPQSLSYFVPVVLLPLGLLLPPHQVSPEQLFWVVVPVVGACSVHAWWAMGGVDVISFDIFLWTLFFYAFHNARRDFKLVSLNGTAQGYPSTLMPRVYWVATLTASLRMRRWKTGNASHDAHQAIAYQIPSRMQFFGRLVVQVGVCFAILCLTTCYFEHDRFLTGGFMVTATNQITIRLMQSITPAIVRPMMLGMWSYALLNLGYQLGLPLIVFVNWLTGFPADEWSPHTMLPHYGSFTHGVLDRGLAGLWGTWWHQLMRQMVGAPGRAAADAFRLPPRSLSRYMVQLVFAFGLSGCIHAGMVPPLPLDTKFTSTDLRMRVASFFWSQAVGIAFEEAATRRLRRVLEADHVTGSPSSVGKVESLSIKKGKLMTIIVRLLRLFYVVAFLSLSIPLLYAPFRELGWLQIYPPPGLPSRIQHILAGHWIP